MAERTDIENLFLAAEKNLSRDQFEIFKAVDLSKSGLVAIVAVAGAGKTRLLSYIVCRAILRVRKGQDLFLLTATRAAKGAAFARIEKLASELDLGLSFPPDHVRTFHSIALEFAKQGGAVSLVGKTRILPVLTKLVEETVNKPDASTGTKEVCRNLCPEDAAEVLYNLRTSQLKLLVPVDGSVHGVLAREVLERLDDSLQQGVENGKRVADFEKLITDYALEEACMAKPGDIIFVDEAQDLSVAQSQIVQTALSRGVTVLALGDDSQGIFVFAGASYNTIVRLVAWCGTTTIGLRQFKMLKNHRSTDRIVAASEMLLPQTDREFRLGVVGNGTPGAAVRVEIGSQKVVPEILKLLKQGFLPGEIVILRHKNWMFGADDLLLTALMAKRVPIAIVGQSSHVTLSERVLSIFQVCLGVEDFADELDDKMHILQTFVRSIRGSKGLPALASVAIRTVIDRRGCDVDVLFLRRQKEVVDEYERILTAENKRKDSSDSKKKQKTNDPSRTISNLHASLTAAADTLKGFRRNVARVEQGEAPRMTPTKGVADIQTSWEPLSVTSSSLTAKLAWTTIRDFLSVKVTCASATKSEICDIVKTLAIDIVDDYALDVTPVISKKLHELHDRSLEDKVVFSTVHKFKGLERRVAFVTNMNTPWGNRKMDQCKLAALSFYHDDKCANVAGLGNCKCSRFLEKLQMQTLADDAETKRLMYVAASRAKERLYMCAAEHARHSELEKMLSEGVAEKWQ